MSAWMRQCHQSRLAGGSCQGAGCCPVRPMGGYYVALFLCWQWAERYVLGLSLPWVRYVGVNLLVCKSIQELEEVPGEPVGVELISRGIQGSDVVHIVLDVCNTGLVYP